MQTRNYIRTWPTTGANLSDFTSLDTPETDTRRRQDPEHILRPSTTRLSTARLEKMDDIPTSLQYHPTLSHPLTTTSFPSSHLPHPISLPPPPPPHTFKTFELHLNLTLNPSPPTHPSNLPLFSFPFLFLFISVSLCLLFFSSLSGPCFSCLRFFLSISSSSYLSDNSGA